MRLLGRESEFEVCGSALSSDRPVAVVISGEAGIGKTALHESVKALAAASGRLVVSTVGLPGEGEIPLINLADVLDPVAREVLPSLPRTQGDALRVALRLEPARPEALDEGLLSRATVNAVRELAGRTGLLVAVDDEQWVDPDSVRLLSVAAARLASASVSWLVSMRAGRSGSGLADGLARIFGSRLITVRLRGLDETTLVRLILDRFPGRWSPGTLRQVARLAAGNPYAAVELARETVASGHAETQVALPPSLTGALGERLSRLEPATAAAVEVCAVTVRPTRPLLCAVLGSQADAAVDDALDGGVLTSAALDPVLRFSHPLLREVAGKSIGPARLRRLHRALAGLVDDAVERAGHLVAGADGPDEDLAVTVLEAAHLARRRSASAIAVRLAEAAVRLTPDASGPAAWDRRCQQLGFLVDASEFEQARALADRWRREAPRECRTHLTVRYGMLATDAEVSWSVPEHHLAFWHYRRGEFDAARTLREELLAACEREDWEEGAAACHQYLSEIEFRSGRWESAERHADAQDRFERESNVEELRSATFLHSLIAGARGDVQRCRALATESLATAERLGMVAHASGFRFLLGELELSVDDPGASLAWLEPPVHQLLARGFVEPHCDSGFGDLVEAYARVGRLADATGLLHTIQEVAARTDHPWGRMVSARAEAVVNLAPGRTEAAVASATAAVTHARAVGSPLQLGRCLLVLGTAQRRHRDRLTAATTLDESIAVLTRLGAVQWASLAQDQRARLVHSSTEVLTPAEQRIADLVAQGATNAEIAANLLISVKTVEANLTRIYRKLGVRNRISLARHR